MEIDDNIRVLLASNSPRRRELLGLIIPKFEIAKVKDVDESYPTSLDVYSVPLYLSELKANAYISDLKENGLLITADTIVINDNKVLGKPHDEDDAVEMLKSLMGRTHTVVTGVTLTTVAKSDTFSEKTQVTFGDITESEIKEYVTKYRPFDKAGAYGIQEWIGCVGITGIEGCFYNVMGLPLHKLYSHIKNL